MKIRINTIENAKKLSQIAMRTNSEILIKSDKYTIDATSVMGLLCMNLLEPLEVEIIEKYEGDREYFISEVKKINILEEE